MAKISNVFGDVHIYPSLISADLLALGEVITLLDDHCDGYHIDIMDDHFVPNLTWGAAMTNAIAKKTKRNVHIHLIVDNPQKWLGRLELKSTDFFIFHYESCTSEQEIYSLIDELKKKQWRIGIAIKPETPINKIDCFLKMIDQALIMSVEPGFSGQRFIESVLDKIKSLAHLRALHNNSFSIAIDGGVNSSNIAQLARLGVTEFIAAAAIFSTGSMIDNLDELYRLAGEGSK